jgi:ATP-binding cassette subfamily C (CFTR/MRP) protein 1
VYLALQIVLLALWADPDTPETRITLATTAITIAGVTLLLYVSYLEHARSVRPSTLITLYLGLSSVFDLARLRTLFFIPGSQAVAKIFLAAYFVKLAIFSLELTEKRSLLLPPWQDASPEATSSVYNRGLFIWLNRLFFKGYWALLTVDSLLPLDAALLSASRPTTLLEKWRKGLANLLKFARNLC